MYVVTLDLSFSNQNLIAFLFLFLVKLLARYIGCLARDRILGLGFAEELPRDARQTSLQKQEDSIDCRNFRKFI